MTAAAAAAAWPLAMRIAHGYALKAPHLAADIEGAAGLGLADALARYRAGSSIAFGTYAHRRITGEIVDLLRREIPTGFGRATRRRGGYAGPARAAPEALDALGMADPGPDAVDAEDAFGRLLRHVSPVQAEVLRLYYGAGLDQADVARRLGITTGSVSVHAHRGRETIRAVLESRRATA